jgi:polyisoprenoid-binding protein YceI
MKITNTLLSATLLVSLFATSCGGGAVSSTDAQDEAQAGELSMSYAVNSEESTIEWVGTKITGSSHNGTIAISNGILNVEEGNLAAGNFDIDMNSIVCLDLEDQESNGKLVGHLKSDDFFDVANFPSATFAITAVKALEGGESTHEISGNLTIKGNTRNISFPASISMDENGLSASASFTIDRTEWDVRYGSTKFFEGLKDNAINNDIALTLSLNATPTVTASAN